MKVMITGANGFLGSHLAKYFHKKGDSIFAISLHTDRIAELLDHIQFYQCSMNRITSLTLPIAKFKPDVVIHCAWSGGNSFSDINLSDQFKKNLPGLVDLMEIMYEHDITKFVGVGSGAEYGNHQEPIIESDLEDPTNLYGVCKYMSMLYTRQFAESRNIHWNWVRPFYTYGPDDVETRLIPRVINQCLAKKSVDLNNCGTVVDYLYIDDFVSAVDALIDSQYEGTYNICSGEAYSIKSVVTQIGEMTGNLDKIRFGVIPERHGEPDQILGDSKKLKLLTKWSPAVSMEEGLRRTIEFYKKV